MNAPMVAQTFDPVETLVEETENIHEELNRLGDLIGTLALYPEMQDELSTLQEVYNGLTSSCGVVAKASLQLAHTRTEAAVASPPPPQAQHQPAALAAPAPESQDGRGRQSDGRTALIHAELTTLIREAEGQQRRERTLVVSLQIVGILLASLVVIALGIRVGSADSDLFLRNLALVLAVGVVAISAYAALFDHRAALVRRSATIARLKQLRRDLSFAAPSADAPQTEALVLQRIKRRLDAILQEETREWDRASDEPSGAQPPSPN